MRLTKAQIFAVRFLENDSRPWQDREDLSALMGKCTTPRANTLASLAELGLAELNTYDNRYQITDKGKEVAQTL